MEYFRLHALGDEFDVDGFLRSHPIDYDYVWHKGELKSGGAGRYPTNGFVQYLGDEETLTDEQQESIAIEYMERHHDGLKALVGWDGVEIVLLGISPLIAVARNVLSVCLSFSPRIVSLAGEIGLTLAFYVRPELTTKDRERP